MNEDKPAADEPAPKRGRGGFLRIKWLALPDEICEGPFEVSIIPFGPPDDDFDQPHAVASP